MEIPALNNFVEAIHATSSMIVVEFAGAGAQAVTWLHSVGGSSRTVLEATDRYASTSLVDLLGFEPEQFTSPRVARAMATKAYVRACHLAGPGTSVAGVGCTATIATDRQKRGEHRCCVAVCNAQGVVSYNLMLTKGLRSRQEEEALVSLLILRAIAKNGGLSPLPELPLQSSEKLQEDTDSINLLDRLVSGELEVVKVTADGHLVPFQQIPHIALLSGAFNPIHDGHKRMAEVAARLLGEPVYFELPLVNADKAGIDPAEAQRRMAQFVGFAPLILTAAPLFSLKAKLFPNSIFMLGVDTVQRLVQLRFYDNDPAKMLLALEEIRRAGCRFLVANRLQGDQFLTLQDLSLPAGFQNLFQEIPSEDFRMDISSTDLRKPGMA